MTWRSFKQTDDGQDRFLKGAPSLRERVARLGIPVRVIWGTQDRLWPLSAADSYRGLEDVRVLELEGGGHSPMIEMPQQTAELIEALAGADGAACAVPARASLGGATA